MSSIFKNIESILSYNSDDIMIEEYWNLGDEQEHKRHNIHAYPAKFPAFIATKAMDYAKNNGISINTVADIFCGCGTVALEAKINNVSFWGCDINPVATLIASVKKESYIVKRLEKYYDFIIDNYHKSKIDMVEYSIANERLRYWFDESHYNNLKKLLAAIENLPKGKYQKAFKCIFSATLKPTSRWLMKSIKPQIDPEKTPVDTINAFDIAYNKFKKAIEDEQIFKASNIEIETNDFLSKRNLPNVSLIITSPPYVTSYEYADLHQLTSLWLGYADDYKELRDGTIGSAYNSENFFYKELSINDTGRKIVENLQSKNIQQAKIKSIARYYLDMQKVTDKCYNMLETNGMAFFVIGDTEYKGIKIENSRHLAESLIRSNFNEVLITKRKITNKLLTPYRDESGRFTTDKNSRKVYHEEFIVIGKKEAT